MVWLEPRSRTGRNPGDRPVANACSVAAEVAVWDVEAEGWVQFADLVPAEKPVVFSAAGEFLGGWMGGLPEAQVLDLIAA